jgi:hypothetical protein
MFFYCWTQSSNLLIGRPCVTFSLSFPTRHTFNKRKARQTKSNQRYPTSHWIWLSFRSGFSVTIPYVQYDHRRNNGLEYHKAACCLSHLLRHANFYPKVFFLDMVEIVDGTANGIYSAVKQVFSELHIPMQNIMGYSSDTTNVMFGEHNSVFRC